MDLIIQIWVAIEIQLTSIKPLAIDMCTFPFISLCVFYEEKSSEYPRGDYLAGIFRWVLRDFNEIVLKNKILLCAIDSRDGGLEAIELTVQDDSYDGLWKSCPPLYLCNFPEENKKKQSFKWYFLLSTTENLESWRIKRGKGKKMKWRKNRLCT